MTPEQGFITLMCPTAWVKATGDGEGEDERVRTQGFNAYVIVVVPMEWGRKYGGGGFPPPPVLTLEPDVSRLRGQLRSNASPDRLSSVQTFRICSDLSPSNPAGRS
jgi:hypothetical protein